MISPFQAGEKCPIGYLGNLPNCVDMDECAEAFTNKCSRNAACTNQIGGYMCDCKSGFYGNLLTSPKPDICESHKRDDMHVDCIFNEDYREA